MSIACIFLCLLLTDTDCYVGTLLLTTLMSSMIFAASEGLTRSAYGHHIQLFCSNEPRVTASTTHASIVSIGYIAVPFLFAYSVTFYTHAGANGWWLPSSSLTDPNIVATYIPWFGCLAQALSLGASSLFLSCFAFLYAV